MENKIEIDKEMEESISSVEEILTYKFRDPSLCAQAFTDPSKRLLLIGNAAIPAAIIDYLFTTCPSLSASQLTLLQSENMRIVRVARVALHHGFHNTPCLHQQVKEFSNLVEKEGDAVLYDGAMEAPKVLADFIGSLVGALARDCENLNTVLKIIISLFEPFVTLEVPKKRAQPHEMIVPPADEDIEEEEG